MSGMEKATQELVVFPAGNGRIEGSLVVPEGARGVVLFAHGTGSSRFSPRNQFVARELNDAGLATLLMDLLTPEEEVADRESRELAFDVDLLAGRLVEAIDWLRDNAATRGLAIGLFGASTGAGAALVAAARRPDDVKAVVSRGGRPDLAGPVLPEVKAPVLLIVGARDLPVLRLNKMVMDELFAERDIRVIAGASHLFEEPGTLEEVALRAAGWFKLHLRQS